MKVLYFYKNAFDIQTLKNCRFSLLFLKMCHIYKVVRFKFIFLLVHLIILYYLGVQIKVTLNTPYFSNLSSYLLRTKP